MLCNIVLWCSNEDASIKFKLLTEDPCAGAVARTATTGISFCHTIIGYQRYRFKSTIGYQRRQTQHNIILITYCQWHIFIFIGIKTYNTISANSIWSNISSHSIDRFDISIIIHLQYCQRIAELYIVISVPQSIVWRWASTWLEYQWKRWKKVVKTSTRLPPVHPPKLLQ